MTLRQIVLLARCFYSKGLLEHLMGMLRDGGTLSHRFIWPIFTCLALFACRTPPEIEANPAFGRIDSLTYTILEVGEYSLHIDSLTPYYSDRIQYFEKIVKDDTIGCLATINSFLKCIDVYSYSSHKHISRIDFSRYTKDNYDDILGFTVITKDSILLVGQRSKRLILIDYNGNLLKEYHFPKETLINKFYNPMASTINPVEKIGNKIYINGFLGGGVDILKKIPDSIENLRLTFSIKQSEWTADLSYPECYWQHVWGPNMLTYSKVFVPGYSAFIYSFPIDHSLVLIKLDGTISNQPAASLFFDKIEPMKQEYFDHDRWYEYFVKSPSYGPIIYDKFQNVFYRIAFQPNSQRDWNSSSEEESQIKQSSVIILNSQFKKIGETLLPKAFYTEPFYFVNRDGLHLGKWSKSRSSNDSIFFGVFKIKPIVNQ